MDEFARPQEQLRLIRLTKENIGPFLQYIPRAMWACAAARENLCVGAVFGGLSCGAAVLEARGEGFYLRFIFVDPAARYCGLGTYLLRGALGAAEGEGAAWVKLVYSLGMLAEGALSGIFARAGFAAPKPVSTCFTCKLGDIQPPPVRAGSGEVFMLAELPAAYREAYLGLDWPAYADYRECSFPPVLECSALCLKEGEPAGVLLLEEREGELFLRGVHVREAYRNTGAAAALMDAALREALAHYGPDYPLSTSVISKEAYSICEKLFKDRVKETEFMLTYDFTQKEKTDAGAKL